MIKIFKDTNNQFHEIDANFMHLLPQGLTEITAAQRDAIINTPDKIKADANMSILAQMSELENQITARVWRETITKPNAPGKNGKTPAQFIADIDAQISVLRGSLQA